MRLLLTTQLQLLQLQLSLQFWFLKLEQVFFCCNFRILRIPIHCKHCISQSNIWDTTNTIFFQVSYFKTTHQKTGINIFPGKFLYSSSLCIWKLTATRGFCGKVVIVRQTRFINVHLTAKHRNTSPWSSKEGMRGIKYCCTTNNIGNRSVLRKFKIAHLCF